MDHVDRRSFIIPQIAQETRQEPSSRIIPINKWMPRVLVFGPGGIKGIKMLGFLSPIEDYGLLEYVDTYAGVSVGALISLLIICGYTIREIVGEAVKLDIFKDISSIDFATIIERKGFISNEPVRKRLTQLVINKFGNVPSLHGLYMMTGKSFVAVTLNVTNEECVMMNPFDYPDISCVDATMFSMNIPFIFYQLMDRGKVYADGALVNPYPVDYFDDGNTNVLGIYVKTKGYTHNVANSPRPSIIQRIDDTALSLGVYVSKIVNTLIDHRRNDIIQGSSSLCRHVCLEVNIDDILGYTITTDHKATMLVEGFNEGKRFLNELYTDNNNKPPPRVQYKYPPYFIREEGVTNNESLEILEEMNAH